MPTKPSTQKQARFFGAIAGKAIKVKGFPASHAKSDLKDLKVSKLPKKAKRR